MRGILLISFGYVVVYCFLLYGETSSNRLRRVAMPNCAMMAAATKKTSIIKKMTIAPLVAPREASRVGMSGAIDCVTNFSFYVK
jgi:hypothetical protein